MTGNQQAGLSWGNATKWTVQGILHKYLSQAKQDDWKMLLWEKELQLTTAMYVLGGNHLAIKWNLIKLL